MTYTAKSEAPRITSCTISWESTDGFFSASTRVLPKEIQVRLYSSGELVSGRIWPLSEKQKQDLFGILVHCLDDWDSGNDASDPSDKPRWQFKICAKDGCLRTVSGTSEPSHGKEIRDLLIGIVGEENFYFFS